MYFVWKYVDVVRTENQCCRLGRKNFFPAEPQIRIAAPALAPAPAPAPSLNNFIRYLENELFDLSTSTYLHGLMRFL
jgi:hypothetical protein